MTYQDYGIQIPNGKYTGEITAICPQCSHNRKPEHQKIKCLGVNLDKKVWRCNHCGWTGGLPDSNYIPPETKIYKKPIWTNKTELSEGIVKWFEKRKISQKTLLKLKITQNKVYLPQLKEEVNCMQFNYFRNGELINIKSRDHKKNFALESGAELIFYNLDSIIGAKEVYITEGEIDTITLEECGIVRPGVGAISVPNGANLNTNNLKYIDNCIELFDTIEKIHLAVDDDIAGRKLREDLAERFGKERCDYIEYNGKKDLNEVLIAGEIQDVIACCSNKKEFPIIGISTVSTYNNDIDDMYINGMDRGVPLKMGKIDNLIRFVTGYITVITGIPNHGKSDWLDQMILKLMVNHGWKVGYYSPENKPTKLHFSKLARKLIGKNWFGKNRMSEKEKDLCKNYLEDKVYFIKLEKDFTLNSLLDRVKQLKMRRGINCFVIDAWNRLEHKHDGKNETKYVNESLLKLDAFCEYYNIHCFLVAHPTKIEKDKKTQQYLVPTLYNISGSAHFYNIVANGITVYRDFVHNVTKVFIQKVKFSHWGEIGTVEYRYDKECGRYNECNVRDEEGKLDINFKFLEDKGNWITGDNKQEILPMDGITINNAEDPPF